MKIFFGFFILIAATTILSCPAEGVLGLSPATQKASCIQRWLKDRLVMVVEKECVPCRELLERMRREMPKEKRRFAEVLWLDTNPATCLESSLKFEDFGDQWCVKREEVQEKWQIRSSPMVFWIDGQEKKTQRGKPNDDKSLPWFRFSSRSMIK